MLFKLPILIFPGFYLEFMMVAQQRTSEEQQVNQDSWVHIVSGAKRIVLHFTTSKSFAGCTTCTAVDMLVQSCYRSRKLLLRENLQFCLNRWKSSDNSLRGQRSFAQSIKFLNVTNISNYIKNCHFEKKKKFESLLRHSLRKVSLKSGLQIMFTFASSKLLFKSFNTFFFF